MSSSNNDFENESSDSVISKNEEEDLDDAQLLKETSEGSIDNISKNEKETNEIIHETRGNVTADADISSVEEEIDLSCNNVKKEMMDKILGEINMSEEDLEEGVVTIKQWITTQPHLPPSAQNDNLLKAFIIACESVETAKKTLLEYFECRAKYQEPFFKNRDANEINWKACNKFARLPGLSPEGYVVNFMQLPSKSELKDFDIIENCRASFMNLDILAHSDQYMNAGHLMVCDGTNFSARFMFKCMFNIAGQSSVIVQKAYPIKMVGFITFNAPGLAEFFFNTFMKPFLAEELRTKNYMYSADHNAVAKHIPIEMLPSDYEGGRAPSMEQLWSETKNTVLTHREWLLKEGSELINEQLRPKDSSKK